MGALELHALVGIGEVRAGDDLAALVVEAFARDAGPGGLREGDVLVVTSKVVSKAEGRVVTEDRDRAVAGETVRVVARRGGTRIVENRLGLVMAAAGVDASNVEPGRLVLLPTDPDASARALREELHRRTGRNVAVVVADTAGRAWRTGQTDIAIGVAGLQPLDSFAGTVDGYGNPLAVTEPAIADELAGAAELASGKLGGRPVVVVRGLAGRVLATGEHGPGARALQRPAGQDMFGLGAREAVVAALAGRDRACFGAPATAGELVDALAACGVRVASGAVDKVAVEAAPDDPVVAALAHAHGWRSEPGPASPNPTLLLVPSP